MNQTQKSRRAGRQNKQFTDRFHSTTLDGIKGVLSCLGGVRRWVCRHICPWDRAMSLEIDRLTVELEARDEHIGMRGKL